MAKRAKPQGQGPAHHEPSPVIRGGGSTGLHIVEMTRVWMNGQEPPHRPSGACQGSSWSRFTEEDQDQESLGVQNHLLHSW